MTSSDKAGRTLYDLVVEYTNSLDARRRQRLAEFLDVQVQTIRCWQRGKTIPAGIRLLKMHFLLDQIGEVDLDWKLTDPDVICVGKLVAFKALTVESVIAEFKGKVNDEQNVVRMLCGHAHIKSDNQAIFKRIAESNSQALDEAIKKWSDLLYRDPRDQIIAELSHRLLGVLPLCEQMISDDWTAEDRHELRQRCGQETVFKLYNALGALCGEKARQHTLKTAAAGLLVR